MKTMSAPIIKKNSGEMRVAPNLSDYSKFTKSFSWDSACYELTGSSAPAFINLACLAVDRHLTSDRAQRTAIRWLGRSGAIEEFTFSKLAELSDEFARVLRDLGAGRGDRVFALLGRVPELYVAALGTLKNGSVFCPLFSAFGPEPLQTRLNLGTAKVLVTTEALYLKKVAAIRTQVPSLEKVLIVGQTPGHPVPDNTLSLDTLIGKVSHESSLEILTKPEDMALLHFTSGTTGKPKGAVHVHQAAVMHYVTGKLALDLHPDDIFWCTADPGWVTGTSYGIFSPLLSGVTSIVDEGDFDAERWYRVLQDQKVTVWYTAPTAIRMLMKAGPDLPKKFDLRALRFIGSVGEPLNPEAVIWSKEVLGLPIHDNWWQTETGGIMIANFAVQDIKPGSMGLPMPGVEAAIVERVGSRDNGIDIRAIDEPNKIGELALKPGWPSMFRGYLGEDERYRKCFAGGFYLTGDLARRDDEGYYWFVGRADDVIKSSGHLIGPFEVESALMEHPAVAEAAVIGKPDPVAGEIVKAFVSLKAGYISSDDLRSELLGHARKRLGAAIAPKEISILASLPRTRSGKLMRRLLKARELGLPEGDLSTLEGGST